MYSMVERLDEVGRPAWIAAMIAGFVLFFPLGLAILAFLIWSGRMGCSYNSAGGHGHERWQRKIDRMQERMSRWQNMARGGGFRPSGNRAFDEYRNETIQRLQDEANEFRDFLDRLRHARDKAEFDQFMAERRARPPATNESEPRDNPRPSE